MGRPECESKRANYVRKTKYRIVSAHAAHMHRGQSVWMRLMMARFRRENSELIEKLCAVERRRANRQCNRNRECATRTETSRPYMCKGLTAMKICSTDSVGIDDTYRIEVRGRVATEKSSENTHAKHGHRTNARTESRVLCTCVACPFIHRCGHAHSSANDVDALHLFRSIFVVFSS